MEKKNLVKLACAALLVPTLASCNEELEVIAENSKDAEKRETMQAVLDEYTSNFESRYGTIDPTHDWGMTMSATSDVTRATVDNRNEWVSKYHLEVPGWPDDYYKSDGTPASNGYHYLNSAGTNASYSDNPPAGSHPAGDVTDEEIQYVSWWFRTHKYPTSVKLHWTDFYVQGISADNDRDAEGKRIDILERYKQNSEGSFFFDEHSSDHTTYTIDYFSAAVMQPDPEQYPDGWDHIKNYNRGNSNVLDGEDNLYVGTSESNAYALTADYKNNLSNSNLTNRLIAFYQSSGTENFRAHYSQNNADLDWNVEYNNDGSVNTTPGHEGHQSWVLVYLHFTGPSGRVYEGYYLGFDYQVFKEEDGTVGENNLTKYTLHKADGYYSNWIFKLSPALPHVHNEDYTGLSRRIMCEDLGNTYDFDFNDVVFDATYNITKEEYNAYLNGEKNESPIDVTITLQAAGGTMPIYVGESPKPTFEAHFLLGGYPSSTPVNVGGASSTVSIYHYKLDFPQDANSLEARKQALSLNNIPIYVQSQDKKGVYLLNSNTPWATPDYKDNGHHTPSNVGTDLAPRAFGVPIGVCWMNECKFIETSYPHFADWVGNMESYGEDSENPWYMTEVTNTGDIHVYSPYVKPAESGNSPVIDNFDYSQYGTVLSHGKDVISGDGYTSVYDFIEFSEFPKQPGMYTITAVCVAKNSDPEINEPQLVRAKKESGFWSEENNNKVYGSVVRDENYNENKRYVVQFTIDVNPANYGGYTHYLLKNMYDKQNDQIGDLYVKRVGDSNYQGNVTVEYPQYGSKATYSKEIVNQTWGVEEHVFLSLSSFQNTASGTYTVTAICETNNHPSGWTVPDVKYCVTDKTNYGQEYAPSSKQTIVVDGGKNIGAVQFSISFPIANDNNYPYLDIKNIIGGEVKDLKEIRIAAAN